MKKAAALNPFVFVTGCNAAFFNTAAMCLQSFSHRMPGQTLYVCDYGMSPSQKGFLRERGILLEAPPDIDVGGDPWHAKTALLRYLRHNEIAIDDQCAVVWVDADLTFMNVGLADFEAVLADMQICGADVAICLDANGNTIEQIINFFGDPAKMQPFSRLVDEHQLDRSLPYFTIGFFLCRSQDLLSAWHDLTARFTYHPLFEQNTFNVLLHASNKPVIALECDEWQAQGASLDRVQMAADQTGEPTAFIGTRPVRALHTTSPFPAHCAFSNATFRAGPCAMTGIYKLFCAEPLKQAQLHFLEQFVNTHREALVRHGVCTALERSVTPATFTVTS